jgi:hypothetical protein
MGCRMGMKKQIIFNQSQIDIVNEMMERIPGINSFSDAVRYAVLAMDDKVDQFKDITDMKKKLNTVSKNIDVLNEMVAGGFHAQNVKAIGRLEDTYIYDDAMKNVQKKIQRSTTVKRERMEKKNTVKVEKSPSNRERPFSKNFF